MQFLGPYPNGKKSNDPCLALFSDENLQISTYNVRLYTYLRLIILPFIHVYRTKIGVYLITDLLWTKTGIYTKSI